MNSKYARRPGLTLIEVVLAVSLLVMLMGVLFWFYNNSLEARRTGLDRTRRVQLARVIIGRMVDELRQASGNTQGYGPGLIGFDDSFSVNTLVLPDKILSLRRKLGDETGPAPKTRSSSGLTERFTCERTTSRQGNAYRSLRSVVTSWCATSTALVRLPSSCVEIEESPRSSQVNGITSTSVCWCGSDLHPLTTYSAR